MTSKTLLDKLKKLAESKLRNLFEEIGVKIEKRKKSLSMTELVLIFYFSAGIGFVVNGLVLGNVLSIVFGLIFLFPVILWIYAGKVEGK